MSVKLAENIVQQNKSKNRIFLLITILIPVLFFLFLELALQLFDYDGNLQLFVSGPEGYENYLMINPDIGRRYFYNQTTIPSPQNDIFLKEKPSNGYRIFLLGGSSAAGFPYGSNLMFSRMLNLKLSELYPKKKIEIVNVSTSAINTYSLLDFTDEILEQSPDVVMIYAGHNEYYGALGIASVESLGSSRLFVKLLLKTQKLKTYRLLRNVISNVAKAFNNNSNQQNQPSGTLMERLVAQQTILYKSDVYNKGINQFKGNLAEIIQKIKSNNVEVILSELVSNLRDQRPFISVKSSKLPPANEVYTDAIYAENKNDFSKAKELYQQAKDYDALRFRASTDINNVIKELGEIYSAEVIQMIQYFEAKSNNELMGNNLFLEHLHPNITGYKLMAKAFLDYFVKNQLVEKNENKFQSAQLDILPNYTELDSAYGAIRIRILKGGWPFKSKAAPNNALIDYHPHTKAESLVVDIWKDKTLTLEHGHFMMAKYFESKKEYRLAAAEYRALIATTPWNNSPYLGAADMFIKAGDYKAAKIYLIQSLNINETSYANKWLGQIYLNSGKTNEAIRYLEKAYRLTPTDFQLAYNMAGAYALLKQYQLALEIIQKVIQKQPNFPGAKTLEQQLLRALKI